MTDKTRSLQGCYRRLEEMGIEESNQHGCNAHEILLSLKTTLTVSEMDQIEQLLVMIRMSKASGLAPR